MNGRLFAVALASAGVFACAQEPEAFDGEIISDVSALHGPSGTLITQDLGIVQQIYQHESVRWWRWALALPHTTGPIRDQTGAACGLGQYGPIWLLAGTDGGHAVRDCTIPRDKFLFFPLINHIVNPPNELFTDPSVEEEYLAFVDEYFPYRRASACELHLRLDGVSLLSSLEQADADLWTEELDPFKVYMNADNYASEFGFEEGLYFHATEGGHFALMFPLTPGPHTLEFGGTDCLEDGTPEFEVSVLFNLTVQ